MMKRCLSLLLVVGLIAVLALPVSADANISGWIELLESSSIDAPGFDPGSNLFTITGTSGSFTLPVATPSRFCMIDLLVSYTVGNMIKTVNVVVDGANYSLSVVDLGDNLCRIYGKIPYVYYSELTFNITKTGSVSAYYQLLSCKASSLRTVDYNADAYLYRNINDPSPLKCPNNFTVAGKSDSINTSGLLLPLTIKDWRKYDRITIFGSFTKMALNSVRPSVGTKGLPFEITYTVSNPTGTYTYTSSQYDWYYDYNRESADGTVSGYDDAQIEYHGNLLYTITIDLSGVDRTISGDLVCYFTLVYDESVGYAANVQGVTGTVDTADTTDVSWWNRFTSFMTDLFGGEDPGVLDDLGDSSNSISNNTDQIHGFEQSQQAVLDNNFAQIQTAVTFTNFAAALVFVQKYANMTFSGISGYAIVFTLPLFLGLFFYLCSRIPGITRWKTPPPRSKPKGGGKP